MVALVKGSNDVAAVTPPPLAPVATTGPTPTFVQTPPVATTKPPVVATPTPVQTPPVATTKPPVATPDPVVSTPTPKPPVAVAQEDGVLSLGSKPPCQIFIDGRNTGLMTPQREIKLSPGPHKITLLNNEIGFRDTFTVNITAGQTTRQIKDYSDKIAQ